MPCAKHRIIFKTGFAYGPGILPGFHFTAGFERRVFEHPATGILPVKPRRQTSFCNHLNLPARGPKVWIDGMREW